MNEERVIVVVPRLNLDGAPRTVGDLVFTTRQVFLARRTGGAELARAFDLTGGRPGRAAQPGSLPRAFARSLSTRFSAPRTDARVSSIASSRALPSRSAVSFSSPSVRLIPRHGKRVKLLGKRAALELLASSIPDLVGAGAPISLT